MILLILNGVLDEKFILSSKVYHNIVIHMSTTIVKISYPGMMLNLRRFVFFWDIPEGGGVSPSKIEGFDPTLP